MKIGEYKVADYATKQLKNEKKVEQNKSENIGSSTSESGLISKNAAFVSDVKAINETMMSIELAGNSMQKISGDKMEEAVKDLRNITASLKEMLSKSFAATNENKDEYSVDALKAKLQGTNPSNLHDFDYLATKAASLLA
ncbi:MAG TPA: hypothetical protein PKW30_03465 [Campylobacterales bacterium]|nr:hypothetical protein [Campylobacterales bacterium]